ncbi:BMP family ABC transporter substrate-binding protein [Metabacillus halosaccharovorans]|uniref:BMP family ABC transporter substrate-binding protein n=1 Tax=Metabacillus halosaccharovorans TaxID=930124 RepID=A0ABT3DEW2_9BACI|nr:BMP family ABC transporter substrate-binding protein [Metabacillus halosaccharovorans]MCV9885589.1 BMP family ABC transporter substrate-binding protein [Metabacillus halosaccharovorans]
MKKKWLGMIVLVIIFFMFAACSQESSQPAESSPPEEETEASTETTEMPRVAFVYIGVPGDGGWTFEHDKGRQVVDEAFGITSTTVENVPEGPDAERVIEELAQDHDIIFTTSFGYMDPTVNVAKKYPDVIFMHATGYKIEDNLGTYQGKGYQPGYLAGIAAGKLTKNNKIGYVGAFPIPEVIYTINAFTLGAQSVNPDIEVSVVWSNTWFDPATERQAAITLLDEGVDVLANYQDSPAGIQAAAERGVWGMGNDSDMNKYAPDTYVTNPTLNWGPYYVDVVQSVIDGTWEPGSYYGGLKEEMIDLAPYGKNVPQDVQAAVEEKKQEIIDGSLEVFTGPITDQTGEVKLNEGETMPLEDILSMNWFVKGVKGTIPE